MMQTKISYEQARAAVLDTVAPVDVESVSLMNARGRTLRESVVSTADVPPFDNAAMDGYAVRAADVPTAGTTLPVAFSIAAGESVPPLPESVCARITTGHPLPAGADAVVRKERTQRQDERIVFEEAPSPGQNVRPAGEDVAAGTVVLEEGTVVGPSAASLLASVGHTQLTVARRPQVLILVTGSELIDAAETPGPGQIRDTNGPSLALRVEAAGGLAHRCRVHDSEAAIRDALIDAPPTDLILVSGGMSVGHDDRALRVLDQMGMTLQFHGVRQRPGKPVAFGLLDDRPVLGLPGNPVAAAVCFVVYSRPALATLLGRNQVLPELDTAILDEGYRAKAGYHYFTRGVAWVDEEARLRVRPTGPQGSGIASSMHEANCLIHLDEDETDPDPGQRVAIQWLAA
jgi:molybdopterin molybdotransferase